ncbi:MAG: hypothetical protein AAGA48_07140 [Myxococcota bacterium]
MIALFALAACSSSNPPLETAVPNPAPTTAPSPDPTPGPGDAEVVTLTTRDDVSLEADFYAADGTGGPAFVLLHMIPPGNDRGNWPASFISALSEEGWAVLALDRRGAGNSGGNATEAYTGPSGKYDVEAATLFLADRGYGDVAIIGASNGTTSMIDYTVWAGDNDRTVPVALGFMTGGNYTESQTEMSTVPQLPSVFTFSTAERAWSEDQRDLDPGTWSFQEYDGGAHGTRMFDAKPDVTADLVGFFGGVLAE